MVIDIINSYCQELPYRVVEVIVNDYVKYKITQPRKNFFGVSKKYYDVTQLKIEPYTRIETIIYFKNKEQIQKFISENTIKIKYKETIVFDSIINP